jgi:ABC-type taurine transport system substrate-binding protein
MLNAFDPAIANRYFDFYDQEKDTRYTFQFFYLSQGIRAMAALENGELDFTASGSSPLSLAAARGVAVETVNLIDIDELSQG